jgi:hypothetical protein
MCVTVGKDERAAMMEVRSGKKVAGAGAKAYGYSFG